MSKARPSSILCHLNEQGNLCLGDSIIHLPFLRALRQWAPEAEITVYPRRGGVKLLDPIFSACITRAVDVVPDPAAGDAYDWVFDLVGENLKTALRLRRSARRRFFSTAVKGWLHLPELPLYHGKHVVRRHLRLLRQATGFTPADYWPWPLPEAHRRRAAELLPEGRRYAGIAPGAGNAGRDKRWPLEHYVALAKDLTGRGFVPVVFLGPEEKGWESHFSTVTGARFPEAENAARAEGPDGPALVVALAGRLDVAVTNCCGSGHMFALGGAPLVSLFGPTSHEKFAPFCRRGVCVSPPQKGDRRIENVRAEDVMAALLWAAGGSESLQELQGRPCLRVSYPDIDMNRAATKP